MGQKILHGALTGPTCATGIPSSRPPPNLTPALIANPAAFASPTCAPADAVTLLRSNYTPIPAAGPWACAYNGVPSMPAPAVA